MVEGKESGCLGSKVNLGRYKPALGCVVGAVCIAGCFHTLVRSIQSPNLLYAAKGLVVNGEVALRSLKVLGEDNVSGISATAGAAGVLCNAVKRVNISTCGLRGIALVVHQLTVDDNLIANLDVGLAGFELLVLKIKNMVSIKLCSVLAGLCDIE